MKKKDRLTVTATVDDIERDTIDLNQMLEVPEVLIHVLLLISHIS